MLIKIKCVVGDCFERVAQKLGGRGCSANRWQTNVIKRDCNDTGHNPQPKSASRFHACSVSSGSSKMPSISCMWAGLIFPIRVVHPRSRRSVQDGISTVRQSHAYHEWSRITDHIMTHDWLAWLPVTTLTLNYLWTFTASNESIWHSQSFHLTCAVVRRLTRPRPCKQVPQCFKIVFQHFQASAIVQRVWTV